MTSILNAMPTLASRSGCKTPGSFFLYSSYCIIFATSVSGRREDIRTISKAQTDGSSSDFLLFMPTYDHTKHVSPLHAVLSFYSTLVTFLPSHTLHQATAELQSVLLQSKAQPVIHRKFRLADFFPHPGYFISGAIAGGISRTATAPLDRLKVYLLAATKTRGNLPVSVIKAEKRWCSQGRLNVPMVNAIKDLWRLGGFRTLFTGM